MGAFFTKWSQTSLVLRILVGLLIGVILGLTVPQWTFISVLGFMFVSALKAIAPILVITIQTKGNKKPTVNVTSDERIVYNAPMK